MNIKNSLEGVIDNDTDEILAVVNDIATRNKNNFEQLKKIILESKFSYKYELLDVPNEKFLDNIIMCLLYSSIDPYIANTPIMKHYQSKVSELCEKLGLNSSNVVPVCLIEEKLQCALL